jgi:hypothetical protein
MGETDDQADAVLARMRGELTAPTETFAALMTREQSAAGAEQSASTRAGAP